MEVPQKLGVVRRALRWIRFWTSYPFVVTAFRIRERQRFNRHFPVRWLSQARVIAEDLEYYEPEGNQQRIDLNFADDVLKVRGQQQASAEKFGLAGIAILAFLAANAFGINLSVSAFGVNFKKFTGAAETLIVLWSMLTFRGALIAGRIFILDGYLRYIVEKVADPQLRAFYMIKYTPDRFTGMYYPLNLPHIVTSIPLLKLSKYSSWLGLLLLVTFLAMYTAFISYLLYKTWVSASLGPYTYAIIALAAATYLFMYLYSFFSIGRLPRRDYTSLQTLDLLRQVDKGQYDILFSDMYDEGAKDRINLERTGYLRPLAPNSAASIPPLVSLHRDLGEVTYPSSSSPLVQLLMASVRLPRQ